MQNKFYGDQTEKALLNFNYNKKGSIDVNFIQSVLSIKKAACLANQKTGKLSKQKANCISQAIDKIIHLDFSQLFPLPAIQGGAGTAFNMNVNEVIANIATELIRDNKSSIQIDPLDDVNMSQSTNDVLPSALRIALYKKIRLMLNELVLLINSFKNLSNKYLTINKLGRTHLQDAVPMTVGQEFMAYGHILEKNTTLLNLIIPSLLTINMGGTAIGTGVNASPDYQKLVIDYLSKIVNLKLEADTDLIAGTQYQSQFAAVSGLIKSLAIDLAKIANDLRLLSSGPGGGIGEIILPEVQMGSTIMPGKVNPVIPEFVNQICYQVIGNDQIITMAAMNAQLELGVMLPVISDAILSEISNLTDAIRIFKMKCIDIIAINKKKCQENLERSTAYSASLLSKFKYSEAANIVKKQVNQI